MLVSRLFVGFLVIGFEVYFLASSSNPLRLAAILVMSFQSGSDGSASSNSPTLVQANLANFEMLDLAKAESGSLTNADASDAGRRPGKLSDSKPEKDSVAPIDSAGGPKGVLDVTRKFLTRHGKLMKINYNAKRF